MDKKIIASLAHRAGVCAEGCYQHGLKSKMKTDGTPVTSADLAVSELLKEVCHLKETGFLGEETQAGLFNGPVLYADEIDGTTDFELGGTQCATALTFGQLTDGVFSPTLSAINNWRRIGCYVTDGRSIQSFNRAQLLKEEASPPNTSAPTIAIPSWPTAWYPMKTIATNLSERGMVTTNPGSAVSPVLSLLLGEVDAILFPGANNSDGVKVNNAAREAAAVSLFAQAANAIVSDLKGEPLRFQVTDESAIVPDIRLRHGFMVARTPELYEQLRSVINSHVTDW